MKENHYTVFNGIKNGKVILMDPYYGQNHSLPINKFLKMWAAKPLFDKERKWFIALKGK